MERSSISSPIAAVPSHHEIKTAYTAKVYVKQLVLRAASST
jgi:hypothetical protein